MVLIHWEICSEGRKIHISLLQYNKLKVKNLRNAKCLRITSNLIEDPLMKKIRQLDKLVDELAKAKVMDKILR